MQIQIRDLPVLYKVKINPWFRQEYYWNKDEVKDEVEVEVKDKDEVEVKVKDKVEVKVKVKIKIKIEVEVKIKVKIEIEVKAEVKIGLNKRGRDSGWRRIKSWSNKSQVLPFA